jgi:hypothetical protein
MSKDHRLRVKALQEKVQEESLKLLKLEERSDSQPLICGRTPVWVDHEILVKAFWEEASEES